MGEVEIVISILAMGISVGVGLYTWKNTRPVEKQQIDLNIKQQDSSSMLTCFQIISSPESRGRQKRVGANHRSKKQTDSKVLFETGSISTDADILKEEFNQISVLYELGLVNRENFEKVYAGKVVKFWK